MEPIATKQDLKSLLSENEDCSNFSSCEESLATFEELLSRGRAMFAVASSNDHSNQADLDFFLGVSGERTQHFQVLNHFGFADAGISESDFLVPDQIIQLGRAPNRIDLLTGLSGVSWVEVRTSHHE